MAEPSHPRASTRLPFGRIAVAIALGFALSTFVFYATLEVMGNVIVAFFRDERDEVFGGPASEIYELSFTIGGKEIYYGQTLSAAIATAVLALAAVAVFTISRRRARARAETTWSCPHCLSQIPRDATVCAFCSREVEPSPVRV